MCLLSVLCDEAFIVAEVITTRSVDFPKQKLLIDFCIMFAFVSEPQSHFSHHQDVFAGVLTFLFHPECAVLDAAAIT